MATSNAVRFLGDGGVDDALALEMFRGTVLEAYHNETVAWNSAFGGGVAGENNAPPLMSVQTIDAGKSWQFILVADTPLPEYHTPGTELLGQNFAFDEGNVTIDSIIVAHHDIPLDQKQQAHWDIIEPLARADGRKLADGYDQRALIIAFKAALTAAKSKDGLVVHQGGNVVERIGADLSGAYPVSSTGARNFRDDCENLAYNLTVDSVPRRDRTLIVDPYILDRVLPQDTGIFDTRINSRGMVNSLNTMDILQIAGFRILASNNMPKTNITSSSLVSKGELPAKYVGDYTYNGATSDGRPAAIAFCGASEGKAAVGCVAANMAELGPIFTFMMVDQRRNTVFMKSQMMIGLDKLDVKSAGAIIVDDA